MVGILEIFTQDGGGVLSRMGTDWILQLDTTVREQL